QPPGRTAEPAPGRRGPPRGRADRGAEAASDGVAAFLLRPRRAPERRGGQASARRVLGPHRRRDHRHHHCGTNRRSPPPAGRLGEQRDRVEMAELTIRPDEIRDALERFVQAYEPEGAAREEIGTVVDAGDGIAHVSGLPSAMANELLEFENGTRGLALNLDPRE